MSVATEDLLTTTEAGDLLGVTRSTVARWVRIGRLDGTRIGNDYRVSRVDLLALAQHAIGEHGPECRRHTDPFGHGVECGCVACHCRDYTYGWMGTCARCHRPLVRDGQVIR